MPTLRLLIPSVLTAAVAVGCSSTPMEPANCAAVISPALHIEVRDSLSSAPLAAGAVAWFQTRFRRDSLPTNGWVDVDGELVPLAFRGGSTAGRYTVEVRKPGYHTWTATALVRQGPCGLVTTSLVARLVVRPETP